jgi:hypothetical protein
MRAKPGDALWLTPAGDGRIDTQLARAQGAGKLAAIAQLTGVDPSKNAYLLRRQVAEAIALPADKSWDALAQALRGRGDTDIAELIEKAFPGPPTATPTVDVEAFPAPPTATPTVDEFLSALRGRR